ncbi:MAG TPA: polysaccharide deacetylase family protein [Hanamia sp.]|nr:polysaccharide deacetylase family protein [Hanamia sp.]
MFYFKKTPWILKKLYPGCTWNIKTDEKVLYLTFDDGPHQQATPFVLGELKKYGAKATFFCIGKNVKEFFPIYQQIINDGHKPGNHTYHHLNGWKTDDKKYLEDIAEAAKIIDSELFRPPYGRISRFQLKAISGEKLKLKPIMWDVLSGDFDTTLTADNCYLNVINNAKPGSIIVFHDSSKSFPVLQQTLPRILEYYFNKGFLFKILSTEIL